MTANVATMNYHDSQCLNNERNHLDSHFKSHSTSEGDSSDHPVSVVVIVVVVVAVNFFSFRLLLSNCFTDFLQIFYGCSLGGPLLSLLKSGAIPMFNGIMGDFVQFWANS